MIIPIYYILHKSVAVHHYMYFIKKNLALFLYIAIFQITCSDTLDIEHLERKNEGGGGGGC